MTYLLLFWEFFKTGLFAVGGGLATIPFLMDIAEKYPWFTTPELLDMIAVSESTPGPIGINMATYAGFKAGMADGGNLFFAILGALIATLSLVLPSIIVIMIIAGFLNKFQSSLLVQNGFYALRPAVIGLLAVSFLNITLPLLFNFGATDILDFFNIKAILLFAVLLFGILKFKKHPILYIGIGAAVGIIFKF